MKRIIYVTNDTYTSKDIALDMLDSILPTDGYGYKPFVFFTKREADQAQGFGPIKKYEITVTVKKLPFPNKKKVQKDIQKDIQIKSV